MIALELCWHHKRGKKRVAQISKKIRREGAEGKDTHGKAKENMGTITKKKKS